MTWGNPETATEKLLCTCLRPVSFVWGLCSYARLRAYGCGWLKQHRLPRPVVSVGNLTCGGTGKTPVTIDLAKRLIKAGKKVAILSRGYRRKSREELVIASDGEGHLASSPDCGDEPYMMARAVPQAVVLVGANRAVSGAVAVSVYNADIILLDDGFQHLGTDRDQDIVLIDYNDDPGNDSLMPAGRLREPLSALTRADWVVITKIPRNPDRGQLRYLQELICERAPRAQLTTCRFAPERLRPFGSDKVSLSPDSLSGVKVMALSAIARPQTFHELLSELGALIVCQRAFPDHHWYTRQDLELVKADLRSSGAEIIVTTEKDCARLDPELIAGLPVSALELKTEWVGKIPALDDLLHSNREDKSAAPGQDTKVAVSLQ